MLAWKGRDRSAGGGGLWDAAKGQPYFLTYIVASVSLILLLYVDPLFNVPDGLITTEWFTGKPSSHGSERCSFDYEGSWEVGLLQGSTPLQTTLGNESVINCHTVSSPKASYVAEPCLVLPIPGEQAAFVEGFSEPCFCLCMHA